LEAAMTEPKYSAPALEKGLDILELLAGRDGKRSLTAIADELGRSKSEIFRMIAVLVQRGYLGRDPITDEFALTNRLFDIALRTPRVHDLLSEAVPAMTRLAQETGHSPHLVVLQGGETVVVAAVPGRSDMSFTLRLGYRRPAIDATSGQVIIAFQGDTERQRLIKESLARLRMKSPPKDLLPTLDRIRAQGYELHKSRDFVGITDICCPIIGAEGSAVASIIVACVQRYGRKTRAAEASHALREICQVIGDAIGSQRSGARVYTLPTSRPATRLQQR
jgi:DNA-binding IclR family transcriptional regulator